jgi:hypothetical protein
MIETKEQKELLEKRAQDYNLIMKKKLKLEYGPVFTLLDNVIKKHNLLIYGGIAINANLPEDKKIYTSDDFPDYDIFSTNPKQHIQEIVELYKKHNYHTRAMPAQHTNTYRIIVNGENIIDISMNKKKMVDVLLSFNYTWKSPYSNLLLNVTPPIFSKCSFHYELSTPHTASFRWGKVYERLILCDEVFFPDAENELYIKKLPEQILSRKSFDNHLLSFNAHILWALKYERLLSGVVLHYQALTQILNQSNVPNPRLKELSDKLAQLTVVSDNQTPNMLIFSSDLSKQKKAIIELTNKYAATHENDQVEFKIIDEPTIMFGLLSSKIMMSTKNLPQPVNVLTILETEGESCITYYLQDSIKYATIDTLLYFFIVQYLNNYQSHSSESESLLYSCIRVLTYTSHYITRDNITCFGKIFTSGYKDKERGRLNKLLKDTIP